MITTIIRAIRSMAILGSTVGEVPTLSVIRVIRVTRTATSRVRWVARAFKVILAVTKIRVIRT